MALSAVDPLEVHPEFCLLLFMLPKPIMYAEIVAYTQHTWMILVPRLYMDKWWASIVKHVNG